LGHPVYLENYDNLTAVSWDSALDPNCDLRARCMGLKSTDDEKDIQVKVKVKVRSRGSGEAEGMDGQVGQENEELAKYLLIGNSYIRS